MLNDAVEAAAAGEPTTGFAWIRHGHSACLLGNRVYVFGGVVAREGRKTSELLVLNLDTMEWRVRGHGVRQQKVWVGPGGGKWVGGRAAGQQAGRPEEVVQNSA